MKEINTQNHLICKRLQIILLFIFGAGNLFAAWEPLPEAKIYERPVSKNPGDYGTGRKK